MLNASIITTNNKRVNGSPCLNPQELLKKPDRHIIENGKPYHRYAVTTNYQSLTGYNGLCVFTGTHILPIIVFLIVKIPQI